MKARLYDPQIGRFMAADPTMGDSWRSDGPNAYRYSSNNPVNFLDRLGHETCNQVRMNDDGSVSTGCGPGEGRGRGPEAAEAVTVGLRSLQLAPSWPPR